MFVMKKFTGPYEKFHDNIPVASQCPSQLVPFSRLHLSLPPLYEKDEVVDERTSFTAPVMTRLRKAGLEVDVELAKWSVSITSVFIVVIMTGA